MSQHPLEGITLDSLKDESIPGQESFIAERINPFAVMLARQVHIPFFAKEAEIEERLQKEIMAGNGPKGKDAAMLIRTADGKNFRIYMKADFWFTQRYINGICQFLDSRTEDQTVTFILGTKMSDWQTHILGALISAMQNCKATVNTIAAGYCSIPETIIWCFGQNRDMYRYGALTFCTTEFIQVCPAYKSYFDVFFKRAVEIGIITEDVVKSIWETSRDYLVMYSDYQKISFVEE